jgi:hypothetical protein
MPIKTKIAVEADSKQLQLTLAAFEKYRKAMEEAAGTKAVLAGKHLDQASAAGLFGLDLEAATRSQAKFRRCGLEEPCSLPPALFGNHPFYDAFGRFEHGVRRRGEHAQRRVAHGR